MRGDEGEVDMELNIRGFIDGECLFKEKLEITIPDDPDPKFVPPVMDKEQKRRLFDDMFEEAQRIIEMAQRHGWSPKHLAVAIGVFVGLHADAPKWKKNEKGE